MGLKIITRGDGLPEHNYGTGFFYKKNSNDERASNHVISERKRLLELMGPNKIQRKILWSAFSSSQARKVCVESKHAMTKMERKVCVQ
jgi:hypothetical protein